MPAGEIVRARPLGHGSIDRRAATQHPAAQRGDVMARLKMPALEAPIVRFVAAEMAGIGQHLGIGVSRISMARFEQQDPARAGAQAIREHTPG